MTVAENQNQQPYGQHVKLNPKSVNEFSISLLLKKDKNDTGIGILAFINGFTVKQSLLRYSMSLELFIADGLGLVDRSILQMGSILELSLILDLENPKTELKKTFYVTNIDNSVQSLAQQERGYNVTAYTFAGVSNAWPFTKVYGANYLPSDIIKDIVQTRFTSDAKEIGMSNEVADAHWIPTQNELKTPTIFNQVAPFDAITNMLRRSTGPEKDSTYFFYEDKEGYKLRTVGDMTREENLNSALEYKMFADNQPGPDKNKDVYYRILYLTQHNNADYFKIMKSGVYSGEVVYIDLLNRSVGNLDSLVEYSDEEHRKTLLSLGDFDGFDINTDVFKLKGVPETNSPTEPESSSYDITPASKIVFSEKAWDREDYMTDKHPYDSAQRALFEQNKITIEVYGNPLIKPGDIISIVFPKQHEEESGYSRRLNRNFLVTAVKHNVSGNRFQTIVDLHKDSYEIDILTESKDNTSTLS